jgi:hypothetical protein
MCTIVRLPDGNTIETLGQLRAFIGNGEMIVTHRAYLIYANVLEIMADPYSLESCCCPVDLQATFALAGWATDWDGGMDLVVTRPKPGLPTFGPGEEIDVTGGVPSEEYVRRGRDEDWRHSSCQPPEFGD